MSVCCKGSCPSFFLLNIKIRSSPACSRKKRDPWRSGLKECLWLPQRHGDLPHVHLFDVVNQYRAIFNNDKSGNDKNYDGGLLFSWAMQQVSNHLTTLQVMLPNITEGGSLSNILEQCMVRMDSDPFSISIMVRYNIYQWYLVSFINLIVDTLSCCSIVQWVLP